MKTVKLEDAVKVFTEMFNLEIEGSNSRRIGNKFMIHKEEFLRYEVIDLLQEWFNVHRIDGFGVFLDGITLVWTTFEIKAIRQ